MDVYWLTPKALYFVGVTAATGLVLFFGLRRLRRERTRRIKSAENMDVNLAVETGAEEDDAEAITRSSAKKSIESRFDFIRRVFVPSVLLAGAGLVAVPLLPAVPAAYISLAAGVIAVILGIAAKPLIENAISGAVITFSQPVRINDTVRIDGRYGIVEKITFLYTIVKVWNWNRWIIPNHRLLQKEIENLSMGDEQEWAYVDFSVAPGTDIEEVMRLAKESMQCRYLSPLEPPSFWVMGLEKDAIVCWVAGWAQNAAEAWALRSVTRRNLAMKLAAAGVDFQLQRSRLQLEPHSRED